MIAIHVSCRLCPRRARTIVLCCGQSIHKSHLQQLRHILAFFWATARVRVTKCVLVSKIVVFWRQGCIEVGSNN